MLNGKIKAKHLVTRIQKTAVYSPQKLACRYLQGEVQESVQISYGELDRKARIIAAHLQTMQLATQRVILLYPAGLEFVTAFIGCLYAKVIAVPVNCQSSAESEKNYALIHAIAQDAEIAGILTMGENIQQLVEGYTQLHSAKKIIVVDTNNLEENTSVHYQLPDITDDTIAYLQYTSGSTSMPKGVVVTHKNLSCSLKYTAEKWHYNKKSITLNWAPHTHVYGLVCGILLPLYYGTPAIIMSPLAFIKQPLFWLKAITHYHVTHSGCPNFGYELCVREINEHELIGINLQSWKVAINGGEPVQYETLQKFTQKFSPFGFSANRFCTAFGMSEVTGLIASSAYKKKPASLNVQIEALKQHKVVINHQIADARKIIECGSLLSGLSVKVVDPDTLVPTANGQVGEIWLTGNSVTTGYWNRIEENKAIFNIALAGDKHTYFRTGDLGFIFKNRIYLVGRLKEIIILYGKKYYPFDLELTAASAHQLLSRDNVNVIFSFLVNEKEEVFLIQEIVVGDIKYDNISYEEIAKAICQKILHKYSIYLHAVVLVEAGTIPKTSSGKIQRKLCKQQFLEKQLKVIYHYTGRQEIEHNDVNAPVMENPILPDKDAGQFTKEINQTFQTEVIHLVASILKIDSEKINVNTNLSQYNFDSIAIIKLSALLNEKYEFQLTPAILFEYSTLAEFCNFLLETNSGKINSYYQLIHKTSTKLQDIHKVNQGKVTQLNNREIAIIGMSGIFPGANNIAELWQNLISGKDVVTEIPSDRWDWKEYYGDASIENKTKIKYGYFIDGIDNFDATFFNISPQEAELMDPQQRIFLQIVWQTIEDAGYPVEMISKKKVGLFVGSFSNDYAELLQKNNIMDAHITTGIMRSILANRVSYLLNLRGPSEVIDTACSSSLVAVHHAVNAILNNECEMAIAGGVNALLTPTLYIAASKAGMLSEHGYCKTFDKAANGYARGEGCAAILLKPLNKALIDRDHIYGVIKGSAVNHGGHVNSLTVPNPNAQAEVIVAAHQQANLAIDSITYIEAHGTGTALGDPIEINGLKTAFQILSNMQNNSNDNKNYCAIGAVKTHIGHLESAAGIAGIIKVLLAMQYGKHVKNLHFEELNPYIKLSDSPFFIVDKVCEWERLKNRDGSYIPRCAGINSFGFGGTNAHLVIEEMQYPTLTPLKKPYYLIILSAKTQQVLHEKIKNLHDWLAQATEMPRLADIAYTLSCGRSHFKQRLAMLVVSISELHETLQKILKDQIPENFISNNNNLHDKKIHRVLTENASMDVMRKMVDDGLLHEDYRQCLLELANYYIQSYELDWEYFYRNESVRRISMPAYPFCKEHYWIPGKEKKIVSLSRGEHMVTTILEYIQRDLIQEIAILLKMNIQLINLEASLSEFGFDSISLKQFSALLETRYRVELPPTVFFTCNNILALSQYLLENFNEKITDYYERSATKPAYSKQASPNDPVISINTTEMPQKNDKSLERLEPIAVIGMSGKFPQSKNINEYWEHLHAGHDLITEIPGERWDWHENYTSEQLGTTKTNSKWGGFITDIDKFDAAFFNLSSREANLMDPQHRLFLKEAWNVIEDAGYDPYALSGEEVGVFVGAEFNDYQTLIAEQKTLSHGYLATGNSFALLANRVSYFLNFHGPSETIDTACSSALVAVHRAVNALRNKECSIAIAGGVSLILNPHNYVITSQLGVLSPDGRCKTFDKTADGYVKGEGVAAIMLKPLKQAQRDGDHIYGIIRNTATNHGGKAQSLTAPNTVAQAQLLIKAYQDAAIDVATVTYIETHGTGTELGDPVEIEALKQAFKTLHVTANKSLLKDEKYCGLGSVKTNIGHLEPASGIASLIKVLLAMKHAKIPGNLHFSELNPYIKLDASPFYIINKTQTWSPLKDEHTKNIPRRAGVSSFGFGGTNAHVILEEAETQIINSKSSKPYYLVTLSAKSQESLKQKIIDLQEWLKLNIHNAVLFNISYTLNTGRSHFNARHAFVVATMEELRNTLQELIDGRQTENCISNYEQQIQTSGPIFIEIYKQAIEAIKNYSHISPNDYRDKLMLLADLYTRKFNIDWKSLYIDENTLRTASLPTYPFIENRHWFDTEIEVSTAAKPMLPVQDIKSMDLPAAIPSEINLLDFTLRYLQTIFANILRIKPEQIIIDETYEIYGVDSLSGLEIIKRLEENFGNLSKTLLFEKNNLRGLAQYMLQKYPRVLQEMTNSKPEATASFVQSPQVIISAPSIIKPNYTMENDIAIIGLTGAYPLADNINEFWHNLVSGRNCITEIPKERWDYNDYPVLVGDEKKYYKYGGFISDIDKFDPLFFNISPKDAAAMDPQERLFLQSTWATLEDAGYTRESLRRNVNNNVGVFAGVTYNFYPLFIAEEWFKGNRMVLDFQMFSIANRVSYFLNFNGPSYPIDTACSASLAAIHLACESIKTGQCSMAIAGGVNLSVHPSKYHMLGSVGFLSAEGRCASFAANATGYVPGEGVGSVLLKPLSLALKDNDHIYGVIKASSMNHGGKTSGYTVPNPNAQAAVIKSALAKASIDPRSITYIEAHGTGTALGDPIEIRGLQEAFEMYTQDKQFCAIGSVKTNIGHAESAAGISQLTKVLLQFKHKKLVPSLHAETVNPYIDFENTPFFIQKELTDWIPDEGCPRRAGISSFGAGGTNVHIIVEEFVPQRNNFTIATQSIDQPPLIFLLSALNNERLITYAQDLYKYLLQEKPENNLYDWLRDICYTLQTGREGMISRLAMMITDYEDVLNKLKIFLEKNKQSNTKTWFNDAAQLNFSPNIQDHILQKHYDELANMWVKGAAIPWDQLYSDPKPKRITLPTYPFVKRRCWIDVTQTSEIQKSNNVTANTSDVAVVSQVVSSVLKDVNFGYTSPAVTENANIDDDKQEQQLPREQVYTLVLDMLANTLGLDVTEIEPDAPFQNYGLDSISGIDFVAKLSEHYPDIVTPMHLYSYPDANRLIDYIIQNYHVISEEKLVVSPEKTSKSINTMSEENQFIANISHLTDEEVRKLLEAEINEVENIL